VFLRNVGVYMRSGMTSHKTGLRVLGVSKYYAVLMLNCRALGSLEQGRLFSSPQDYFV
jgi:hypothetical protein